MGKLSDEMEKMFRNNSHNGGVYPHVAASVVEEQVEKYSIEFLKWYLLEGKGLEINYTSYQIFQQFLKQKYK